MSYLIKKVSFWIWLQAKREAVDGTWNSVPNCRPRWLRRCGPTTVDYGPVGSKADQNFMVYLQTDYSRSDRRQNWRSPIVTCVLLESSDREIDNYGSSPIVGCPWMDMVGPQPDLSPAHRVQKGLQNHRPSADRRVGLTDV